MIMVLIEIIVAFIFAYVVIRLIDHKFGDILYKNVKEKLDNSYADFSKLKEAKDCRACWKYRTMDCPNSSRCYATKDKPYFETRDD